MIPLRLVIDTNIVVAAAPIRARAVRFAGEWKNAHH